MNKFIYCWWKYLSLTDNNFNYLPIKVIFTINSSHTPFIKVYTVNKTVTVHTYYSILIQEPTVSTIY